MRRTLLTCAATAGLLAVVTPASADPTVPYTCREARAGTDLVALVCFGTDGGLSGTTVTPVAAYACAFHDAIGLGCGGSPLAPGTFGFVANPSFPLPEVDPTTASIKSEGGTVGTLYYGTDTKDVVIERFCVGDPEFC